MEGVIESRSPMLELTVFTPDAPRVIQGIIDTGFNGQLTMPLKQIVECDLELIGSRDGNLADGTSI